MDKKTYKVKFVKYESINGHTEYTVKVVTSGGTETFHIRDRYRSMRDYWKNMVSDYGKLVPSTFPPKKWIGNKEPAFIRHRMEELEHFFNTLLEDPKLAASPITQTYFANKKTHLKDGGKTDISKKGKVGKKEEEEDEKKVKKVKNPQVDPQILDNHKVTYDKKWRQIVDSITKAYIDISFGEEPPSPEEVKNKSLAYSAAISGSLSTIPFISKVLTLPKGNDKCFNEINLELIEDERPMSEWLDEKMNVLAKIVRNESYQLYPKDTVLTSFEMGL